MGCHQKKTKPTTIVLKILRLFEAGTTLCMVFSAKRNNLSNNGVGVFFCFFFVFFCFFEKLGRFLFEGSFYCFSWSWFFSSQTKKSCFCIRTQRFLLTEKKKSKKSIIQVCLWQKGGRLGVNLV